MGGLHGGDDDRRHRAERVENLQIVRRALDARARLTAEIEDSADREEAAARVAAVLGIDPAKAEIVLDLQWSALLRGTRQRIADELDQLRGA